MLGKGEKTEQFQRFTPEQQGAMGQLRAGGQQQLPQMFQFLQQILSQDPEMMRQFEAPTRRAFEEQTLPTIAERFTGMDAQKSSAFGQQLGQAGAGMEERLGADRLGRSSDAIKQLLEMLGGGLGQQFDTILRPAQTGFLQDFAPTIGKAAIGAGAGAMMGGPAGALAGILMSLMGNQK